MIFIYRKPITKSRTGKPITLTGKMLVEYFKKHKNDEYKVDITSSYPMYLLKEDES